MGYNPNTGKISAPVYYDDIKAAIGSSDNDGIFLCTDPNIKMWAKYKPVRWTEEETDPALNQARTAWNPDCDVSKQWWRANSGNYGLDFSNAMVNVGIGTSGVITALTAILAKIDGAANGWAYERPNGGYNSPYRPGDFLQYNSKTMNPISSVSTSNVQASLTSNYEVVVELIRAAVNPVNQRDYLIPEDITQFSLEMGIAIFKKNGNTYEPIAWVFGSITWLGMGITYSDQSDGIISQTESMVVSRLKDGGTYYVLPIFATAQLQQPPSSPATDNVYNNSAGAPNSAMKFITVPYVDLISFTATRRSTTQIIGVPELSNKEISTLWTYRTTLYLNSTYAGYTGGTTQSVVLAVVNELYNGTPAQGNYAYYNDFGAVTVPANTQYTVGSTGLLSLDSSHSWRVIVSVNGEESTFALRTPAQPE